MFLVYTLDPIKVYYYYYYYKKYYYINLFMLIFRLLKFKNKTEWTAVYFSVYSKTFDEYTGTGTAGEKYFPFVYIKYISITSKEKWQIQLIKCYFHQPTER